MRDDEYCEPACARLAEAADRALDDLPEAERDRLRPLLAEGVPETDWRVRATIDGDADGGCGFRNMDNYRGRIMAHIALTRTRRDAAA